MKIVNRVRFGFFGFLALGHLGAALVFNEAEADFLIVLFAVNAMIFLVASPWLVERFFLRDLKLIEHFIERVKVGDFSCPLPVENHNADEDERSEFMRLRQSLNWMARQIQQREHEIEQEIDRVAELNRRLKRQALIDPMTELYNYGYFWSQIARSFSLFERERRPFSFVMADIDFFKKVNDTYGHPVGDQVIKGIASVLKTHVRDIDVLARIGGEEFGIILNGADAADAEVFLNRLQEQIRVLQFPLSDGDSLGVTMSMGFVAVGETTALTKEDVVKRADDALYYVKHNGRDGIMNWARLQ